MRKSATDRKLEIVEAALKLVAEVGPDRVTTDAIAKAIGVTQAALFRHFPRKADIWMAVLEWLRSQTVEGRWRAAVTSPGLPLNRLRALVRTHLELLAVTPAITALLFSRELHVENDALREGMAGLMEQYQAHLTNLLAEAAACGEIRSDRNPGRFARIIVSLIPGTAIRWSLMRRRFDLVAEGTGALEALLEGLVCGKDRP